MAQSEEQAAGVFLVLEPAVQAARVQLGGVACPPVERQGCADPLARYVIIAIFELFEEGNAVLLLPAFGLDIVGSKLALAIGDAAGDAEILAQPCREIHAALGRELFGVGLGRAACRDRAGQYVWNSGGAGLLT